MLFQESLTEAFGGQYIELHVDEPFTAPEIYEPPRAYSLAKFAWARYNVISIAGEGNYRVQKSGTLTLFFPPYN